MGFEKRFEQYDIFMDKPEPLVPRPLRREIEERVSARGRVLVPLDTAGVRDIAAEWKAAGIEAVAVGLLHAYAHPAHEQAIREILSAELPEATVCLSSEVCPEIREYERFSTTCANAYVRPLMSGYLLRLQEDLRARGMTCPFYLMMSGGGVTTVEDRYPVSGSAHRVGPRRRRHTGRPRSAPMRSRGGALAGHGRHHRKDLPHRERDPRAFPHLRGRPPVP